MGFKLYLEKVNNAKTTDRKTKLEFIDAVWEHLQNSYKSIGGIKGSGFNSKEDLLNIPLWKIYEVNGEVKAGLLYKDKGSRKTVAVFTDGSKIGREKLTELLKADFKRSSIEVSHSLLNFIERRMPSLFKKYTIPTKYVADLLKKDITIIDDTYYMRKIGGEMIRKVMLGTTKKFDF